MKDYECELREKLLASREDFDDIVLGRKLGANTNISSIIHMLEDIAGQVRAGKVSGLDGWKTAFEVTSYFDRMRGDSSIAVRNAIHMLMEPVKVKGLSGEDFAGRLCRSCEDYRYESAHWNEKVVACAGQVLKHVTAMMVYDYSSTVDAVLGEAETWGREIRIFVPESRTLDGGLPFIKNHSGSSRLRFSFIPDCGMAYYIRQCDAALVGVETFCGDGGLYNTTGSLTLAILCKEYGVPFYGITQFIKWSRELSVKHPKAPEEYDMSRVLGVSRSGDMIDVDMSCVGIELVEPEYITGYITEKGLLLPGEVLMNS